MSQNPKNLKEAIEVIDSLNTKNAELQATVSEQENVIADLRIELSNATTKVKKEKVIVKHDNNEFEVVVVSFSFEGEIVKAEELKDKPEVVAKLIEAESSVLVKVN